MSTNKRVFLGTYSLLLVLFFYSSTYIHAETFFRNLTVGDSGSDVLQLQILLNQNYETRVAETGAGSPGYETTYFGARTADAVRRFQELNRQSILIPNGLTAGTGFFGPSTRSFMSGAVGGGAVITTTSGKIQKNAGITTTNTNSTELDQDARVKAVFSGIVSRMNLLGISDTEMNVARMDRDIIPGTVASPTTTRAVADLVRNQNKNNVEVLITLLDESGYLNTMDSKKKDALKSQIREDAQKDIVELLPSSDDTAWAIPQTLKTKSFFSQFLTTVVDTVKPKEALAAGTVPFGGTIYYRFYCYYSQTWALVIAPPGMLIPAWVGYTYVQIYANWNMPFATRTIGLYTPGTQTCYITFEGEPFLIPTMGVITFITGSDLY